MGDLYNNKSFIYYFDGSTWYTVGSYDKERNFTEKTTRQVPYSVVGNSVKCSEEGIQETLSFYEIVDGYYLVSEVRNGRFFNYHLFVRYKDGIPENRFWEESEYNAESEGIAESEDSGNDEVQTESESSSTEDQITSQEENEVKSIIAEVLNNDSSQAIDELIKRKETAETMSGVDLQSLFSENVYFYFYPLEYGDDYSFDKNYFLFDNVEGMLYNVKGKTQKSFPYEIIEEKGCIYLNQKEATLLPLIRGYYNLSFEDELYLLKVSQNSVL